MHATHLVLSMFIVFTAAKLFALLARRVGVPSTVGEILAGTLLGPGALRWVTGEEIAPMAELGVMFLLFRVGLEVRATDLLRVGGVATMVAVLGVVLPMLAGYGVYLVSGASQIEALFVGSSLVATSVGITAQVLNEMGLLHTKAARIILAAAVIDDVLGLIVLAVVSSMAKGQVHVVQLATIGVGAIAFTLLILIYGARGVTRAMPKIGRMVGDHEWQFKFSLILMFALAAAAAYAGVAAIIGAFLAGVALAESVEHRVHNLTQGVSELLTPFFLVSIGLNLDLHTLQDPKVLGMAAAVTVVAVLTKLVGCGLGARSLGKADAIRIGVGMVPRGEVGMVVAQLGSTLGIISATTYSIVVAMAIVTTMIAPLMLNYAFKDLVAEGLSSDPSPLRVE